MGTPKLFAALCCLLAASLWAAQLLAEPTKTEEKELESALALFRRRLSDNPDDYLSAVLFANILHRQASEQGKAQALEESEQALRRALTKAPDNDSAQLALAQSLSGQHRFYEAETLVDMLLANDKDSSAKKLLKFDILFETGRYEESENLLSDLEKILGLESALLYRRARLAEVVGKNEKALELLAQASDLAEQRGESTNLRAWYLLRLGERHLKNGRLKEAGKLFLEANSLSKTKGVGKDHLAELKALEGNYAEASRLLAQAAEATGRPELIQAQGDVALLEKRYADAQSFFDRAETIYLAANERGAKYYYHHLASFYSDSKNNPEKALHFSRIDFELRHSISAYESMAWALFHAGQFSEAKENIDQALKWGTRDSHLFYHASMIYGAAGRLKESRQFLRQAQEISPYYNAFHLHR